jgi:hypothetical protein
MPYRKNAIPAGATVALDPEPDRSKAIDEAIAYAMNLLADAPPGEFATLAVCRGAPLCEVRNPPEGFAAMCPYCECITVNEHGQVDYPGSGRA